MMDISATSAGTVGAGNAAPPQGWSSLGQGDFLRLLTEQLKQQDPTDPVDNKEMLAQLAQFSSVSGITNINATLERISSQLEALGVSLNTPTAQEN